MLRVIASPSADCGSRIINLQVRTALFSPEAAQHIKNARGTLCATGSDFSLMPYCVAEAWAQGRRPVQGDWRGTKRRLLSSFWEDVQRREETTAGNPLEVPASELGGPHLPKAPSKQLCPGAHQSEWPWGPLRGPQGVCSHMSCLRQNALATPPSPARLTPKKDQRGLQLTLYYHRHRSLKDPG